MGSQRLWTRVAMAAALVLGAAACREASAGKLRFAYVTNGANPFWNLARAGAQRAAADLGVEVLVEMPSEGIAHQKQILEDLLTRGVDGIAVSPIDHENQTPLLDRIAAATPLITHDSDAPASRRLVFIGVDNYEAGRMAGELLRLALPQGGKVMLFIGRLEQDNGRLRALGTLDAILQRDADRSRRVVADEKLVGGGFEVLGIRTDQQDEVVAKAHAADALTAHPDLDGMVGLFAHNAPACVEALRQAGRLGEVKVVGFDELDATLQGIADGLIVGTVVQDPYAYGYRSVEVLEALARGDRSVLPADGVIPIPARRIGQAEVEAFWAETKARLAGTAGGR